MLSLVVSAVISSFVTTALYKGFMWAQESLFAPISVRLQWTGEGPEPFGVFMLRLSVALVLIVVWVVLLLVCMMKVEPVLAPVLGVR